MKENLDLKLTPYKVLATSGSQGECHGIINGSKKLLKEVKQINIKWRCKCTWLKTKNPLSTYLSGIFRGLLEKLCHVFYLNVSSGFVQFVESTPVAEVLDKDVDGSIQVWHKMCNPQNVRLVVPHLCNDYLKAR